MWTGGVVKELSAEQRVAAIAVDGLDKLVALSGGSDGYDKTNVLGELNELEDLKYDWFAYPLSMELEYRAYRKTLSELAGFYRSIGVPMMVLKGYGLSLNYPVPEHRPTGDIDIYLYGGQKKADGLLKERLGIAVDSSHHHHTVFCFHEEMVENHYDFINVHSHSSNRKLERTLKRLAADEQNAIFHTMPEGTTLLLPPPTFNALFLARHTGAHFAAERISLRHLLDWALFVKTFHDEVDWATFWDEAEAAGMVTFVRCLDLVVIRWLGFARELFHLPPEGDVFSVEEERLAERMLGDILQPEFVGRDGKGFVRYVASRFRRWRANRWKQHMVYAENSLMNFVVQSWSHLLKPRSLWGGK